MKTKVFATKDAAKRWEADQSEQKWLQEEKLTTTVSLLQFANEYLDYCTSRYNWKTIQDKRIAFRALFETVPPDTTIRGLSVAMAEKAFQRQAQKRSGNAVNKDRKNLMAAWKWGQSGKFAAWPTEAHPNPFKVVDRFPESRTARYVPPLEDFQRVLGVAEGQDKVLLLTFAHTAARRGEIFGLRWEDVDFIGGIIWLTTRKERDGSMKRLPVPMTPTLKATLLKWREDDPFPESPFVFKVGGNYQFENQHAGKPYKYRQHLMPRLCARAGVKEFGLHGIRHLAAAIMYREGRPIAEIQRVLRHGSSATTERYLKSLGLDDGVREAVGSLERLISPKVIPFSKACFTAPAFNTWERRDYPGKI